jgi:hypothetical protein
MTSGLRTSIHVRKEVTVSNHSKDVKQMSVPYIGPLYPITLETYERLDDEQRELHRWACTFVADSNDALSMLLMDAGVDHVSYPWLAQ